MLSSPETDLFLLFYKHQVLGNLQRHSLLVCVSIKNHGNKITEQNLKKQCQTWGTYATLDTVDYHSFAFERFSTKSRMLDCLYGLSLESTRISDTFVTAEDNSSRRRYSGNSQSTI